MFAEKFFAFKFNIGTTNSYRYRYGWLEASLHQSEF